MSNKPLVVAIVGRPNVGKSSLANKIIGRREAIVHDLPGVTRDRNYYQTEWNTKPLVVIDTGGIYNDNAANNSISFQKEIEDQVHIALTESDVIIFLVDGKEGLHPLDKEISNLLRKTQKKIYVVINKMETSKRDLNIYDFYNLGYETIHKISAVTGQGVSDLLDEIITPSEIKITSIKEIQKPIKIAIVGKPNAGKSSLLNALIGRERAIVSPIAGTTRDIIDEEVTRENTLFKFIDTAGIRKKAKVFEDIEYYSVTRAIHAIEQCDIAILLLDAEKLVEEQDQKIAGLIEKNNKGCIIAVNKWDLIAKDSNTINDYEISVRQRLKFLKYCPVLFISAHEMTRTYEIYREAIQIHSNYNFRTTTSAFNKVIEKVLERSPTPTHKGRTAKIYYATQTATQPPTFTFFVNNAELIHFSYKRHLENELRLELPLSGTSIRLNFRSKIKKKK